MYRKAIARAVIVSMLGITTGAFAQQHGPDHHGGPDDRGGPDAHGRSDMGRGGPGHANGGPRGQWHDASVGRPGGPVPHEDWRKGDRLPSEYRDRNYVVDDWRGHGLSAPPRGYHWVGVNGDYVLAAVATGVIASVLMSGH